MAIKTYKGSCHCGEVRFEADIDLSKGATRCNCTYCKKIRSWGITIKPAAFRLLTSEEHLSEYKFRPDSTAHHDFCKRCGVRAFGRGHVEEIGGAFVSIQVSCLDDASPEELIAAPITYCDGRENNWWNPPGEIRHL